MRHAALDFVGAERCTFLGAALPLRSVYCHALSLLCSLFSFALAVFSSFSLDSSKKGHFFAFRFLSLPRLSVVSSLRLGLRRGAVTSCSSSFFVQSYFYRRRVVSLHDRGVIWMALEKRRGTALRKGPRYFFPAFALNFQ